MLPRPMKPTVLFAGAEYCRTALAAMMMMGWRSMELQAMLILFS